MENNLTHKELIEETYDFKATKDCVKHMDDYHFHECIGDPIYKFVRANIDGELKTVVLCKTCNALFALSSKRRSQLDSTDWLVTEKNADVEYTKPIVGSNEKRTKKASKRYYKNNEQRSNNEKPARTVREKAVLGSISGVVSAGDRQLRIEQQRMELRRVLDERARAEEIRRLKEEAEKRNLRKVTPAVKDAIKDERKRKVLLVHGSELISKVEGLPKIQMSDFVVRGNTFSCEKSTHEIIDIEAVVQVLNTRNNSINSFIIPAGYCKECNIFFILESVYEHLKTQGIILCRIEDEKQYLMATSGQLSNLASESLLMQYGYSVSKAKNLSAFSRRRILALIIDSKILTKNTVISYLSFFLRQHKSQENYSDAVRKWKEDIDFVKEYQLGSYEKYRMKSLTV